MPRLIPTFRTGPNEPRNQPYKIFFPSTTNDGFAKTVSNAAAPFLQAESGTQAGLPVPMVKPVLYIQTVRVYSPSRRMFPKGF